MKVEREMRGREERESAEFEFDVVLVGGVMRFHREKWEREEKYNAKMNFCFVKLEVLKKRKY